VKALWLAAVALVGCAPKQQPEETRLREEFMRTFLEAHGGERAWQLSLNRDVIFGSGFCPVEMDVRDGTFVHAHRWMGPRGHLRLKGHGNRAMRFAFAGVPAPRRDHGPPTATLAVDDVPFDVTEAIDQRLEYGHVFAPNVIGGAEWIDLTIAMSTWGDDVGDGCSSFGFAFEEVTWAPVD